MQPSLHCSVPDRPEAVRAARRELEESFTVEESFSTLGCVERGFCEGDDFVVPIPGGPGDDDDPPPPPPPDDDDPIGEGGGSSGDSSWDPYFDYDEEEQLRQACDSPPGQAFEGEWYTCDPRPNAARDEYMEYLMRGNEDAHAMCGEIADEWNSKWTTGRVGWWTETIPRPSGVPQLGHYHGAGGVEPIGHIHIFEGNDEHSRTWRGWLRSAVHETLHALGYKHRDVIEDGLTFDDFNGICSATGSR